MIIFITKIKGVGSCAFETFDDAMNDIRDNVLNNDVREITLTVREMTKQAFENLREFES